jgi:hypothetical protein
MVNNSYDYKANIHKLIIKESSAILFNCEKLVMNELVESIRPEAHFLFAYLKQLCLKLNKTGPSTQEISRMIEQFERINTNGRKIDFVELDLKDLAEKSGCCMNNSWQGIEFKS